MIDSWDWLLIGGEHVLTGTVYRGFDTVQTLAPNGFISG